MRMKKLRYRITASGLYMHLKDNKTFFGMSLVFFVALCVTALGALSHETHLMRAITLDGMLLALLIAMICYAAYKAHKSRRQAS